MGKTLVIKQNTQLRENVSSAVIDKLYNLAYENQSLSIDPEVTSGANDIVGWIKPTAAYADAVAFLAAKFPNLTIDIAPDDCYVRFADNNVKNLLLNAGIGDGIGVTVGNAAVANLGTILKGNTSIVSFNEFNFFSRANGTALPANLFLDCTNLESIDLSELTYINTNFLRNTKITIVNAPNLSLASGSGQFRYCIYLTEVQDLGSIVAIPLDMFSLCSALQTVNLPDECVSLGLACFNGCSTLSTLNGLNHITVFGRESLKECSNLQILASTLSSETTSIGQGAFQSSGLVGVLNFPNLSSLGIDSFSRIGITGVLCLGNISSIPSRAFWRASDSPGVLLYAYIPYETTVIGSESFLNQPLLTTVKLYNKPLSDYQEGENPVYNSLSRITTFEENCFYGCSLLQLSNDDFSNATTIGLNAFRRTGLNINYLDLSGVSSIGKNAFSEVTKIGSVKWNGQTSFPLGIFNNAKIEQITNIDNVTKLSGRCFVGCNLNHVLYLKNVDGYTYAKDATGAEPYQYFVADNNSATLPAFYAPKLPYIGGCYWTNNVYATCFFGSRGNVTIPVVYFRDITDLYPGSFASLKSTSVIINNVTPPTWRNFNDQTDLETTDSTRSKNTIFPSNDSNTIITNIYVPDSAVLTYLNDPDWGKLPIRSQRPINILSMNLLTHYNTEADWVAAGKPADGIIDAYM